MAEAEAEGEGEGEGEEEEGCGRDRGAEDEEVVVEGEEAGGGFGFGFGFGFRLGSGSVPAVWQAAIVQSSASHSFTAPLALTAGIGLNQCTSWRIIMTVACARPGAAAAQRVRSATARFMPSSAHWVRSQ